MALVLKTSGALIVRAAVSANRSARLCPTSASLAVSKPFSSARSTVPQARPKSNQRAGRTGAVVAMSLFTSTTTANSAHEFTVTDIDGQKVDLGQYKGKVLLVVNVASQCGFTPQYKELAELDAKYSKQGLVILGFPCNQFGSQEKASNPEIKKFAEARGAKFPMMAKVEVNGSAADPFYKFLKAKQGGLLVPDIKWNFTKFLVDKEGNVVKRYGSATTPLSIEDDIKRLL